MSTVLEMQKVCAWYGATQVLHEVSLAVGQGQITALLGANGAGKTTTLRAICNLMVRTTGSLVLLSDDISNTVTEDIVRLGVAHVPDGRGTFKSLTVEENLKLGAYARKDRATIGRDFERVYGYFPRLAERRRQQAGTLSGGEQQMLAISRALMLQPKLLLLDEPSFGLAPIVVREIFGILKSINANDGVSMLLVEQNANMALKIAHFAYLLETGSVVMGGDAGDIASDEAIRRSYLGH